MRVLALLALFIAAGICLPATLFAASADTPAGDVVAPSASPVMPMPAVAPVAAVAPAAPAASAPVSISDPNYKIAEDDILRLDVWGEPQFSGAQMAVTPGGTISVPFLGEMNVIGMTQTEVSKLVAAKLQEAEIVADARVQVTLVSMHRPQIRVLGAVQRPGAFEFKEGDKILDAVAQAGSFSDDAMLESASLTHQDSDKPIPINLRTMLTGVLTDNKKLQNGDVLYIPHEDYKNKFYVFGQVYKPGAYSLKDKTDLLTAISLAGGQTPRASIRQTVVVRGNPSKPERLKNNLTRLFDKGDLTQNIALQAGDIVIIPETKTPDWNKISGVIGAMLNVSYLAKLGWL